jgi:hypothetical protein
VALGAAAAGAVAAAVVVTTGGHSSTGSPERKAVVAYVDEVNRLQNRMHAPLARVMLAYASFGRDAAQTRRPSAARLGAATATLTRLEQRLAALACPPEAVKLRRRLLELARREAAITSEVQLLARFAPSYVTALGGLRTASRRLDATLKAIKVPKPRVLHGTKKAVARAQRAFDTRAEQAAAAQADAVGAYDLAVGHVLTRLRQLRPPPALQPEYRAQLAALRKVTAAGTDLASRLRDTRRTDIAAYSRRFALASRAAGTLAVQRAQVAAIRAYNERARQVGAAAGAVQTELARLRQNLP